MAKNNFNEIWIDGFNLFYKWSSTRHLFSPGCDIKKAQEESIRKLADALQNNCRRSILFMDGGIERGSMTFNSLRIKYPGSGRKADELLEEQARGKQGNKRILAVTSDRFLAATLRRYRIKIIDSNKFIQDFLRAFKASDKYNENKPEVLSKEEVDEWLDIFSEEE